MTKNGKRVLILFGSPSDKEIASKVTGKLKELLIPYSLEYISAHRDPKILMKRIGQCRNKNEAVIIAGAGMSAHLAGAIASNSNLPVIGIPVSSGQLSGIDALLSTVQMPPGVPVATVGINGGENAALLAARILALSDNVLEERLKKSISYMRAKSRQKGKELKVDFNP